MARITGMHFVPCMDVADAMVVPMIATVHNFLPMLEQKFEHCGVGWFQGFDGLSE